MVDFSGPNALTGKQAATRTQDLAVDGSAVSQLGEVVCSPSAEEDPDKIAAAALSAYNPGDALEMVLAAQLAALNHTALECLGLARYDGQKAAVRDMELRHGAKALDLHSRLFAKYEKRRKINEFERKCPNSLLTTLDHL